MPIDGVNGISNEQLMAMSLMSNGQLTNESTSSSDANEYNNLAFQMMMQNYMESAKNNAQNNVNTIINNSNVSNSANGNDTSVNVSAESNENSNESVNSSESSSDAAAQAINTSAASKQTARAMQTYLAGQKLTDIPLVINGSYNGYAYGAGNIGSISSNRSPEELNKIYSAVSEASKKYGVSESLILAVIKQESDFDSTCTSGAGAAGLMQIMPGNYSSLGITDPYDVNQNVNGGTQLLREYLDQYNQDIQMALMAYNGGPGTMKNRGVRSASDLYKMPSETQNYVPRVMGYYQNGI